MERGPLLVGTTTGNNEGGLTAQKSEVALFLCSRTEEFDERKGDPESSRCSASMIIGFGAWGFVARFSVSPLFFFRR